MKHQTLRIIAYFLGILAWLTLLVGILASVIIGIGTDVLVARIAFTLGGLVVTAISMAFLLAASRLIHLFIEIEEDLHRIKEMAEKENQQSSQS